VDFHCIETIFFGTIYQQLKLSIPTYIYYFLLSIRKSIILKLVKPHHHQPVNSIFQAYISPDYPELVEVNDKPTETAEPEDTSTALTPVVPVPSPVKEPLRDATSQNDENIASNSNANRNKCAICNIQYNSEAYFPSHWIQCNHKGCGWWVHCRCICIWYPTTNAGLKALNKWAMGKVFCPRHIQKL